MRSASARLADRRDLHAELVEALAQRLVLQDLQHLGVETRDDRRRRAGRHVEAEVQAGIDVEAAVGHGRPFAAGTTAARGSSTPAP